MRFQHEDDELILPSTLSTSTERAGMLPNFARKRGILRIARFVGRRVFKTSNRGVSKVLIR